jgi:mannose-6-phosphate isomerase-like protein (cupin superfamily)
MSSGLLAGIGLTRLRVYEQRPAPDGTLSGCAHVHAFTDEAYYVVAGRGALELHDVERGFRRVPLQPGDFVQFGPGTLHRSVSESGLDILALMSNSGLAERGDARIYFGAAVDADPAEFERLRALAQTHGLDGALQRRDTSTLAYTELLRLWNADRPAYDAELRRFVDLHRRLASAHAQRYEAIIDHGPAHWLRQSLERLHEPVPTQPEAAGVLRDEAPSVLGMCGLLRQVPDPAPV